MVWNENEKHFFSFNTSRILMEVKIILKKIGLRSPIQNKDSIKKNPAISIKIQVIILV